MSTTETVYQFIVRYKVEHGGSSPSIRDIMDGCRLRSTSTVHYHLGKLSGDGRIRLSGGGQSRSIVVPGGQWIPPREAAQAGAD